MGRDLRELLSRGPFVAADAYSPLTGRIVEQAGFGAAYLGGHSAGIMHHAIPDVGILAPDEQIELAARIASAISIPLIADADTAGFHVAETYRVVQGYERARVAAIHIEDEMVPRHSNFDAGLVDVAEMQAKLEAAVAARKDPDFLLIARCDEFYTSTIAGPGLVGPGSGSIEEGVRRGRAYAEVGADVLLVPFASGGQVATLAEEVGIPIAVFGRILPSAAFGISTGWGVGAAAQIHRQLAERLAELGALEELDGFTAELTTPLLSFPDKRKLTDEERYEQVVTRWVDRTERN